MKIVTGHERADMDALASIYAASLLYPDYVALLPHNLNRNLREFLALHADTFSFATRDDLPREPVSDLLLVDTQKTAPLRGVSSETRQRVIDHHAQDDDLHDKIAFEGEPLGAATTLLVERLRSAGREIPHRVGATLLLMGIYEDTGSLSYGGTTSRDVGAAAWLLEQGADLALADSFLHHPLTEAQRDVYGQLVANATVHSIQGRAICVAGVVLEHYVDELSSLVHPLMDLFEPDACLLLAEYEGDVQVIARSTNEDVDVGALLREFDGGGHPKAAAALVESSSLDALTPRLLSALECAVPPPVRVREIMSTNVHTLGLAMSVREAGQMMRRYGHEGFPVVEGERLVGILTRSDVDRALHHRLDDAPVSTILHTGPIHVVPDDSVDAVQRAMIDHGLGQVPVVEGGRFMGIVTRTDLIKLWTPDDRPSRSSEMRALLDEALPAALGALIHFARDAANDLGHSLYVVGGFPRDLLLGTPSLDLDLVVEGDAIAMAKELGRRLNEAPEASRIIGGGVRARVRSHSRFGTAKVILEDGPCASRPPGMPKSLDFVTARTEFYERPTVLPQVERSSIKQDLYRRDFTINTLAICLDRDRYGELLDYYGGERDLREGRIRVLHNLSMVEDPTRILRAVRFEQRLGFTIEERTAQLIDDALDLLDDVSGERLRNELYLLLREREPERVLSRLARMGILGRLHSELRFGVETAERFQRLRDRFHEWPVSDVPETEEEEPGANGGDVERDALSHCYLTVLTSYMPAQALEEFVQRLRIPGRDARLLEETGELRDALPDLKAEMMLPSTVYSLLHAYSREARFVLSVLTDDPLVLGRLELYERELAEVRAHIDGNTLRAMGARPGPAFGAILDRVRDALLDGLVETVAEEEALARRLVAAAQGTE